jgi:outer membrane protein OmpA-like peptidoglycan-associated protein
MIFSKDAIANASKMCILNRLLCFFLILQELSVKKISVVFFLLLISTVLHSQTYKDGWGVGFGLTSPRMFGDTYAEYFNLGGHLFLQRDFDEVNSVRFKVDFLHFTSNGVPSGLPAVGPSNTTVAFGFDYIYGFSICHPVKLYFGTGFSGLYFKLKDAKNPITDGGNFGELSVNFIVGTKYALSKEWDLRGEFALHQVSTDRFDGIYASGGGLFGGTLDSYITSELGVVYYFDRGAETKICDLPGGVTNVYNQTAGAPGNANIDYDRIQRMIDGAKSAPVQVDYKKIEDIIDAKLEKALKNTTLTTEPVLVGINFDVNDATIKSENYAILAQDVAVLLSHPSLKVEVAGYTDKDGSEKGNLKLSEKRAVNVKNYLVAKGVDAARLSVKAYGEANPVSDAKAMNRRVELKIVK